MSEDTGCQCDRMDALKETIRCSRIANDILRDTNIMLRSELIHVNIKADNLQTVVNAKVDQIKGLEARLSDQADFICRLNHKHGEIVADMNKTCEEIVNENIAIHKAFDNECDAKVQLLQQENANLLSDLAKTRSDVEKRDKHVTNLVNDGILENWSIRDGLKSEITGLKARIAELSAEKSPGLDEPCDNLATLVEGPECENTFVMYLGSITPLMTIFDL